MLLGAAVRAIAVQPGQAGVAALARSLAVSERQLRGLFAAGIGLSPKHYARIARLRLVLERAGRAPWAHLAADTGYYDHSHLAAEFRTLMGVSPSAFAHGALPRPPAAARSAAEIYRPAGPCRGVVER